MGLKEGPAGCSLEDKVADPREMSQETASGWESQRSLVSLEGGWAS